MTYGMFYVAYVGRYFPLHFIIKMKHFQSFRLNAYDAKKNTFNAYFFSFCELKLRNSRHSVEFSVYYYILWIWMKTKFYFQRNMRNRVYVLCLIPWWEYKCYFLLKSSLSFLRFAFLFFQYPFVDKININIFPRDRFFRCCNKIGFSAIFR